MIHGGVVACDDCTKYCMKNHQKEKDLSSTVFRFFKIMHGKDCSDVLYLPPKFARHVRDLAGQKTQIEDSNGKKWTVKFSYVDGALAFQEGWNNFFVEHQLEYGEIVVFNYMKQGHFIVQIYGLSACEIINFNRRSDRPNKRLRRDQEVFQDEPCQMFATTMDEPSSTPLVSPGQEFLNCQNHPTTTKALHSASDLGKLPYFSTSKSMEDPSCMLHRGSVCYQAEDRDFLFDLSRFEMGKNSLDAYRCETFSDRTNTPVETQIGEQIEAKGSDTQISMPCKNHSDDHSCDIFGDALHAKISYNSDSLKDIPCNTSKFQADSSQLADDDDALKAKPCNSTVSCAILKYPLGCAGCISNSTGKKYTVTKKEVVELGDEVYGFPQVPCGNTSIMIPKYSQTPSSAVKTEPDTFNEFAQAASASPFSAEVKSQYFLELPSCIPSIIGKREKGRGKVVYLRDSTDRLWPVLFPDTSFVKALTDGWKTFSEGNNIRVGDECRFRVESYMPCIYRVDVIHKTAQS